MLRPLSCCLGLISLLLCPILYGESPRIRPSRDAKLVKLAESKKDKPKSTSQIKSQAKDATIEFQGSDIKGIRKNPLDAIRGQDREEDSDFVSIPTNWRKQIVESAENLGTTF